MQSLYIKSQEENYPMSLAEIASSPKGLYIEGELTQQPRVAIVGTRKPTDYGRQAAAELAGELAAAGVSIVSGLALGIDGIAHQAALEAGGHTVAVLAHGLDLIYPAAHRGLAKRILDNGGALVSEYQPGTQIRNWNFVARNRIVSGLCQATVVVEADAKSGALITANFALEQGRQVMAVPGNITNPRSAGPNNLLRAGATPVTSAADILEALDLEAASQQPVKADSAEEALILELLGQGVNSSQRLIEHSGLSASQFANIISLMEITGKVRNLGAGNWSSR